MQKKKNSFSCHSAFWTQSAFCTYSLHFVPSLQSAFCTEQSNKSSSRRLPSLPVMYLWLQRMLICGFALCTSWKCDVPSLKATLTSSHPLSNRPLSSCVLSYLAFECKRGWRWPCFDTVLSDFLIQLPTSYHENNLIYTSKAVRSVSKQGHLQSCCHSKARSLSK